MRSKLSPKVVSLSLASVSGILYVLCAASFMLAPETTLNLFKGVFHGFDITQIAVKTPVTVGNIFVGFIETVLFSLAAGWLFAVVYNYLLIRFRQRD